jgi:hypothetical protein
VFEVQYILENEKVTLSSREKWKINFEKLLKLLLYLSINKNNNQVTDVER